MRIIKLFLIVSIILHGSVFLCQNVFGAEVSASSLLFPSYSEQSSTNKNSLFPSYPLIHDSYFTDDLGNILMVVNVLGEINRPGQIVVQEDADFATILTLAGGLKDSANQKKVLVARKEPDRNGARAYVVDLRQFFSKGDRANFITLKPNDTIIIPEKGLTFEKITNLFGFVFAGATGVYYIKHM